jgi:hypothetical protein
MDKDYVTLTWESHVPLGKLCPFDQSNEPQYATCPLTAFLQKKKEKEDGHMVYCG